MLKIANALIKRHESIRLKPYQDSEKKRLTIGWGRNLEDRGITTIEADFMLDNDIGLCVYHLRKLKVFSELSENRQAVLVDMVYNLGYEGFLKFKDLIKALEEHDYEKASQEMLDSLWAKQVKTRAVRLAKIMKDDSL